MLRLSEARVVFSLALGSILKTRTKTLVVGFLLFFGSLLTVGGTALLDSINDSMTQSITGSLAGHLQIYSESAKDKLSLFGSGFMGNDDYGTIPSFGKVKEALSGVANIEAIVPMGFQYANVRGGNPFDNAMDELRQAEKEGQARALELAIAKIKHMVELMRQEREKALDITQDKDKVRQDIAHLERVLTPAFWEEFRRDAQMTMMFLDATIAPIDRSGDLFYLQLLGTDVDLFRREFKKFIITDGQALPPGERGVLISKYVYEKWAKNKAARNMDHLYEELTVKNKIIAADKELRAKVKQMSNQYGHITFDLNPESAETLERELKAFLPGQKGDLTESLKAFLAVDDENFLARYAFFYKAIAPKIKLYLFKPGDIITLTSFTKGGYVKSRNLKLYGVYSFKGMEKTEIAGIYSLVDMLSFRDLYGSMEKEQIQELDAIRAAAGVAEVERQGAEEALFGGAAAPQVKEKATQGFDEFEGLGGKLLKAARQQAVLSPVTPQAIENGLALNAAIVLKDPQKIRETQARIEALSRQKGLKLRVVDWEEASGIVGQFVILVRFVLYIAITIIFLVALVIINNSMIMATMERVSEIGTMRAIGAQGSFVLGLFMTETFILGLAAGLLGSAAAWGLISFLGRIGIPAEGDALTFLFSGPKLFPSIHLGNVLSGLGLILFVSAAAAFFPSLIATKVKPAVAMQHKE